MILRRYLYSEVLKLFAIVLTILLLIFICDRFVHYLDDASEGRIAPNVVFKLVAFKLGEASPLLLPLSFYIAMLLTLSRMYSDNEITAMISSGIGMQRISYSFIGLVLGFAVITAVISFYVAPISSDLKQRFWEQAKKEVALIGVRPGQFVTLDGGRVVYIENISDDGLTMKNVFVRQLKGNKEQLLIAEKAYLKSEVGESSREIVFVDGNIYEGIPGQADYAVTKFKYYGFQLGVPSAIENSKDLDARSSWELVMNPSAENMAEFQWRLSFPLSVIVLSLLVIPLAKTAPREGRFGKLVAAILLYLLYNNLLTIAKTFVEKGDISALIGVWPVHVAMALLGIVMLHNVVMGHTPIRSLQAKLRGLR